MGSHPLRVIASLAFLLLATIAVGEDCDAKPDTAGPLPMIAERSWEERNAQDCAVVSEALGDPALRVRKATRELVESLGPGGEGFLEV